MAASVALQHLLKRLRPLTLGGVLGLCLLSCGSSRLAPEYVASAPTAIAVDSLIEEDPTVVAYIQPYKEELDARMDSIIGFAAHELQKEQVESALGNFVADLTREAAQQVTDFPVDMGLVTIGGLRIALPAGPIRIGDIFELMPFENKIVVLELTGEQTRQLLEFTAQQQIVALSNTKVVVQDGALASAVIGGEPFDPSRNYTVATSDYLAGGGDKMSFLREAALANRTDLLLRTAIVNKIMALQQQGQKIDARIEGRVEVIE